VDFADKLLKKSAFVLDLASDFLDLRGCFHSPSPRSLHGYARGVKKICLFVEKNAATP
jgi:hypothetical protein